MNIGHIWSETLSQTVQTPKQDRTGYVCKAEAYSFMATHGQLCEEVIFEFWQQVPPLMQQKFVRGLKRQENCVEKVVIVLIQQYSQRWKKSLWVFASNSLLGGILLNV